MKKLFILALLAIGGLVQAQNGTTNILLRHDNKPIDFTKINEALEKVSQGHAQGKIVITFK